MRNWLNGFLLLAFTALLVDATEFKLDQKDENRQRCAGMYNRQDWGGPVDPYILVNFDKFTVTDGSDPVVSLVIFEWRDEELIGRLLPGSDNIEWTCTSEDASNGYCNSTEVGAFLLQPNASQVSKSLILTQAIHLKNASPIEYKISNTGYYCVGTVVQPSTGYTGDYTGYVEFREAYGELPAAQIPKLPFYGILTIAYAVMGVFWAFLYAQHRHDILPVQNYITAIIIFLVVEMVMTWLFYDYQNRNGANVGAKVLMIIVAVLNAGRNSFSFFLLLIVCMGYGVVKPSLGKTMIYVRWLAGVHFIFGLIYSIASLTITPESAGPLVLFVILPLAGTLTAFYVWTLNSLNFTMKDLYDRKQTVKAFMYRKLWWCILTSIIVIFGFFFFNSFTFAGVSDPDFVPFHWKSRWFILDGWLNLVYIADVAFVAYLWRPTANNRRFAMSDELAQDDEGFEIADFAGDESADEEEGGAAHRAEEGPRYDPPTKLTAAKPKDPQQSRDVPRESLDGETIFAVGEDGEGEDVDEWSDSEGSGNHRKLVENGKPQV